MCVRTCVYVLATDGVVTFVSAAAGACGFVVKVNDLSSFLRTSERLSIKD